MNNEAAAVSLDVGANNPASFAWLLRINLTETSLGEARRFIEEHRKAGHYADVYVSVCGESVEMTLNEFCERLGLSYRV